MIRSLSVVSSKPKGVTLSRGSHCLQRQDGQNHTTKLHRLYPRKTKRVSPSPLVVEEQHQIEPPVVLLLPLLPQTEDVFRWDGDGHPVV